MVIALITVTAAIGFSRNAEFQRTYDYGYERENLLGVWIPDESSYHALRDAVRQLPGVEITAGTRHHIGFGYAKLTMEAKGEKRENGYIAVGENYLELMDLKIAAGRPFDPNLPSDFENTLLVSEKFAAAYGWSPEAALSQQVKIDTVTYTIAGVVHDFHQNMLFEPIQPVALRMVRADKYQQLIIRARPGELTSTYDQVKAAWAKLFPLKSFNGFYQDEVAAEAMKVTTSIAQIFAWFAIVSILLTATGLFALVSLTVLKKMKEIAVRRVVGASPGNVVVLVNKGYFWILIVATGIGSYGGFALTRLLMDSIFKINVGIGVTTLATASASVLLIALSTVGVKVWQAIRANPAEVLKGD